MPFYVKPVQGGDPSNNLEVYTPVSVLKAKRFGKEWVVFGEGRDVIAALSADSWGKPSVLRQEELAAAMGGGAAPAAKPKPVAEESGADMDLLDNSVKVIEKLIRSGDYDDHLQAYLDAEEAGKTRKGVVEALKFRMSK